MITHQAAYNSIYSNLITSTQQFQRWNCTREVFAVLALIKINREVGPEGLSLSAWQPATHFQRSITANVHSKYTVKTLLRQNEL